jgi:hypothetical protein
VRPPLRRFFRHGLLPQLIAFEACVRLGSVTRAGHELSLAQPTVSCMLRKLSDTMGGPVTVLRDRRIEATPLGSELLLLCRDLFAAFQRFEERGGPAGGTGGQGPGYDRGPETHPSAATWPSNFPSRGTSRWTQPASPWPLPKPGPVKGTGAS